MSYLFLDVETSGMPSFHHAADDEAQARIVQLGLLVTDTAFTPLARYCEIIRPTGWTVEPGAEAVHGISTQRAMDEGIPIEQAIQVYRDLWAGCETILGFSVRFDLKFIRGELRRCGHDDQIGKRPVFEAMTAVKNMVGARGVKGQIKNPKLTEAYLFFAGPDAPKLGSAHDAGVDCEMTRVVCKGFVDRGGVIQGDSTLEFSKAGKEAAAAAAAPVPRVPTIPTAEDLDKIF